MRSGWPASEFVWAPNPRASVDGAVSDMQRREFEVSVRRAKATLADHGRTCQVSLADLRRYFQADTPYPDLSLNQVLRIRFLTIHELVLRKSKAWGSS